MAAPASRLLGPDRGVFEVPADFDGPLPDDVLGNCHLTTRDPFDRLLVAQASIEGLVLLTADRVFDDYDVEVFRVE